MHSYTSSTIFNFCHIHFTISILDQEPPKFTACPSDILITTDASESSRVVNWPAPEYSDNSGEIEVTYASTTTNSKEFPAVSTNNIKYIIQDKSKNSAECDFIVKLEGQLMHL